MDHLPDNPNLDKHNIYIVERRESIVIATFNGQRIEFEYDAVEELIDALKKSHQKRK